MDKQGNMVTVGIVVTLATDSIEKEIDELPGKELKRVISRNLLRYKNMQTIQ
jgi:hypothetical protein